MVTPITAAGRVSIILCDRKLNKMAGAGEIVEIKQNSTVSSQKNIFFKSFA